MTDGHIESSLEKAGEKSIALEAEIWYTLMTICGEVEGYIIADSPLTEKQKKRADANRRIWNGFVCRKMEKSKRDELAKKLKLDVRELTKWGKHEENLVKKAFMEKSKANKSLKNLLGRPTKIIEALYKLHERGNIKVEIINKEIDDVFYAEKFIFPEISFLNTIFKQKCHFTDAIFENAAVFTKAKFCSGAHFNRTTFNSGDWKVSVNFDEAEFFSISDFRGAIFRGTSSFTGTTFHSHVDFMDAHFEKFVPHFYGSAIEHDMAFTIDKKKWPLPKKDKGMAKASYSRLRQLMHNQHKPDEEQFFYRQEMAWKAQHERSSWINWAAINLYGCLSDYGHSLRRPFWIFLIALICPAFFLVPGTPQYSPVGYWGEIGCALRLSATNMFPLLEFASEHNMKCKFPPDNIKWLWHFVSLAQYLASVVFLFLFALALRTRFRLR